MKFVLFFVTIFLVSCSFHACQVVFLFIFGTTMHAD